MNLRKSKKSLQELSFGLKNLTFKHIRPKKNPKVTFNDSFSGHFMQYF